MLNSTVPKYTPGSKYPPRQQDPEAQSAAHMLSESITERSSITHSGPTPEQHMDERERQLNTYSGLPRVLDFFWGGVYAPGASTHDPIKILLNTEDPEERDRLTDSWRDNRLNELSFVGVVVRSLLPSGLDSNHGDTSLLSSSREFVR